MASTSRLVDSPAHTLSDYSQPGSPALPSYANSPSAGTMSGGAGAGGGHGHGDDSDDDEEAWDEVDVMADNSATALAASHAAAKEGISIVIGTSGKRKGKGKAKPDGSTTRERMIRQQRHKVHAACHLALGLVRNRQINDKLLQARLMSIVPLHLQNAFFTFSRTTHPNERDRVRLFDAALKDLLDWWDQYFEINDYPGVRRRPVPEVEDELKWWLTKAGGESPSYPWEDIAAEVEVVEPLLSKGNKGKKKKQKRQSAKDRAKRWGPTSERTWEIVNGPHSLAKYALLRRGSRDVSVQLFTCICRALDIPSRLVFSLQPVDWHAPSSSAKRKGAGTDDAGTTDSEAGSSWRRRNGKSSAATSGRENGSDTDGWEDGRGRLTYKLPKVNLRRSKPAKRAETGLALDDDPARPPVFWTEVWSRYTRQWITTDPIRRKMRCKSIMEPSRSSVENQLLYVVAFEEDNTARDVTPRYAKSYNNYTVKARAPSKRNTDWFAALIMNFERSFQLNRDRDEQKELWDRVANEPFPTSVGGFKNHPNYVLEQHLHRDQVIRPGARALGLFKATEPVYARSAVVELKSKENYWRMGRIVKEDEIPWKFVKSRTVTINRRRAEAVAQMDGGEVEQQPLYAIEQTEMYVPPAVVAGKIPKNDFGNIDLYVPSMLPAGAIHLTSKQAAKCAKTLGFDYAEAIVGFEFRQRRANPIINGVVVAQENADVLIQAVLDSEEAAEEKEFIKLRDRSLKRWKKLILGLRIRQRLQVAYHDKPEAAPTINGSNGTKSKGEGGVISSPKTRDRSPPRKRAAVAKPLARSQPKRSAPPTPSDSDVSATRPKRSTTGRSLRLNLSASKDPPARTTRARAQAASKSSPSPAAARSPKSTDGSSDSDAPSFEYESD